MRIFSGAAHSFDRGTAVVRIDDAAISPGAPTTYLADDGACIHPLTGLPDPALTDRDVAVYGLKAGYGVRGASLGGTLAEAAEFRDDMRAVLDQHAPHGNLTSQQFPGAEKGPDARRRPRAAGEAYSLYVEPAAAGANEADGPLSASAPPLDPAAVDDVALVRARAAVVGGEEQHHARDVLRQQLALQALPAHQLLLALRRQPER